MLEFWDLRTRLGGDQVSETYEKLKSSTPAALQAAIRSGGGSERQRTMAPCFDLFQIETNGY